MSDMKTPIPMTLIVAATSSNAIGRSSSLPWRLPKEMAYFARVTKGEHDVDKQGMNAVIMGRKSWEGIPAKFRPLSGRVNVVISRQQDYDLSSSAETHLASSLSSSTSVLTALSKPIHQTFLIGGSQLYSLGLEATSDPAFTTHRVLLTRIKTEFSDCDAFLPDISEASGWKRSSHEDLCSYVGFEVPEGDQKEKDRIGGGEVIYEFQMWTRK